MGSELCPRESLNSRGQINPFFMYQIVGLLGLEHAMESSRNKGRVTQSAAESAARVDPDLSTVIAAWPDVPKEIKSAILTMVCVIR